MTPDDRRPHRPGDTATATPRTVPPTVRWSPAQRADIESRVKAGELVRRRRGRYAPPVAADVGPARRREQSVLQLVAAVASTLRTDVVYSHETAALLHGLPLVHLAEEVHVSQSTRPRVRAGDRTLRRHAVDVPARDRTVVDGRPVTTLERTAVDCARHLPGPRALVVADGALRAGADPVVVQQVLTDAVGRPGVRRARHVLALADARAESPGESLVRWAVDAAGRPAPEPGLEVATGRGSYWVDLGWPRLRVAVEFDGAVKYSGGGYGDPRTRLLAEKRRQDALTEAGWTVLRVVWADLADTARLVDRVRRALATTRSHPRVSTPGGRSVHPGH